MSGRTVTVRVKRDEDTGLYKYGVTRCMNTNTGDCTWKGFAHEDYDLVTSVGRHHVCKR